MKSANLTLFLCTVVSVTQPGSRSRVHAASPDTRYASPEETFKAIREALKHEDYRAVCQCYTDDGLSELAGGLRMRGGFITLMGSNAKAQPDAAALARAAQARYLAGMYRLMLPRCI